MNKALCFNILYIYAWARASYTETNTCPCSVSRICISCGCIRIISAAMCYHHSHFNTQFVMNYDAFLPHNTICFHSQKFLHVPVLQVKCYKYMYGVSVKYTKLCIVIYGDINDYIVVAWWAYVSLWSAPSRRCFIIKTVTKYCLRNHTCTLLSYASSVTTVVLFQ